MRSARQRMSMRMATGAEPWILSARYPNTIIVAHVEHSEELILRQLRAKRVLLY